MKQRPWRHQAFGTRSIRLLLIVIMFNSLILLSHHILLTGPCSNLIGQERNTEKTREMEYSNVAKLVGISNATKFFNWEKESQDLSLMVPVMQHDDKIEGDYQVDIETISTLKPIEDSPLKRLITVLKNEFLKTADTNDVTTAIDEGHVIGCAGLSLLDDVNSFPRLKQGFSGGFFQRGELDLDAKRSHDVTTFTHYRVRDVTSTVDRMAAPVGTEEEASTEAEVRFELAAGEMDKLMTMRGWPGIPQMYAVCLRSRDGRDVTAMEGNATHLSVHSIRYVVHRYDKGTSLCEKEFFNDDCDNLKVMMKMVRSRKNPALAAIQLMIAFTNVFANFWKNGVFPYKLRLKDVVITKDFDVIITSMHSLEMFSGSLVGRGHFVRPLSDVSCRTWVDCPTPGWQGQQLLFRFGQHCKEVRGYCDESNRCWGLDTSAYLCLFSKWIFTRLHNVVPTSWEHDVMLTKLLTCAEQGSPDYRCSWTSFQRTLRNVVELAEEEWG